MLNLTSLTGLLADFDRGPYEQGELMGYAFLPLLLAVIIFWIGIKMQMNGKPQWIKWLAIVPLVFGVILGLGPTQKYYGDSLYNDLYGGTWKKGMLHSAGVWMPIVGAIGLFLWHKWVDRQKFDEL